MEILLEIFENEFYMNILSSVLLLVLGYLLRSLIIKITHKKIVEAKIFYKVKKTITYIYFFIVITILLAIWTSPEDITTYLGLVSAGIAIALKDLVTNVAAWLFILFRKPFDVGDRVEIDGVAGDVIDQRVFQFTVMEIGNWVSSDQSTGRLIHLPNNIIFTSPIANFTSGFEYIWNEIEVLLTFESDYKKAKDMFLKIAEEHSLCHSKKVEEEMRNASKKYMIYYNKLTPIIYTDVRDNGVNLSIRYLCKPHQRRNTTELIWEDVLSVIDNNEDLDLAYSTLRVIKD